MTVSFDLDSLHGHVAGARIAVVATPAGWIPGMGTLTDHLAERADVLAFFALEHGLRGELQDGVLFDSYVDPRTDLPVHSFYGHGGGFPEGFLAQCDILVFHAQDVSHRAYTYKQALAGVLEAAASAGVKVVVMDRPSPLGHRGVRGPMGRQFFPTPLPVVIPYTLGELARFLKAESALDLDLAVVPVRGWSRSMQWVSSGLPWIPPSPNLPGVDSVICYACSGAVQHTNASEARGTAKPFEYVGAPYLDAEALVEALIRRQLPGFALRAVRFLPQFNKYAGEVCQGVHLMVENPLAVDPVKTQMVLIQEMARQCPGSFALKPGFCNWLDNGDWTEEHVRNLDVDAYVEQAWEQTRPFEEAMRPLALYQD